MNELKKWMTLLLDMNVSAEGIKEFEMTYRDILYATSISYDQTKDDMLNMFKVIDMLGDENTESEILRRFLYYIYGKFIVADIYAGVIGEHMRSSNNTERILLDEIMNSAITKIISNEDD
jgi:hypothetical protein